MSGLLFAGAKCPGCGGKMLSKWESDPDMPMFDACPECGFAHGFGGRTATFKTAQDVFDFIMKEYDCTSVKDLREEVGKNLAGLSMDAPQPALAHIATWSRTDASRWIAKK